MEPLVGQDYDRHYIVITCGTSACGRQACNVSFVVIPHGWVTVAGPPPVLCSVSFLHGTSFCSPCSSFISFLLILEVHLSCPALPCPPLMVPPPVQSPAWVFWGLLSPHHRLTCCGWQWPRRLATGCLEAAAVAASCFKTF